MSQRRGSAKGAVMLYAADDALSFSLQGAHSHSVPLPRRAMSHARRWCQASLLVSYAMGGRKTLRVRGSLLEPGLASSTQHPDVVVEWSGNRAASDL